MNHLFKRSISLLLVASLLIMLSPLGTVADYTSTTEMQTEQTYTDTTQEQPDEEQPDEEQPNEEYPDGEQPDEEYPGEGYPGEEQPDGKYPDEEQPDEEYQDEEHPDEEQTDEEQTDEEQQQVNAPTAAFASTVNLLSMRPDSADRDALEVHVLAAVTTLSNNLGLITILENVFNELLDPAAIVDLAEPMLRDLIHQVIVDSVGISLPPEITEALVNALLGSEIVTEIVNSNFVADVLEEFVGNMLDLLLPSIASEITETLWNNGNPSTAIWNSTTETWIPGAWMFGFPASGIAFAANASFISLGVSTIISGGDVNEILDLIGLDNIMNAALAAVTTVAEPHVRNWVNNSDLVNAVRTQVQSILLYIESISGNVDDAIALAPYVVGIIDFILNYQAFYIVPELGTAEGELYVFDIVADAELVHRVNEFLDQLYASSLSGITSIRNFDGLTDRIQDELPFILSLVGAQYDHGWSLNHGAPDFALDGSGVLRATSTNLGRGPHDVKVSYRAAFTFPWLNPWIGDFEILLTLATESVQLILPTLTLTPATVNITNNALTATSTVGGTAINTITLGYKLLSAGITVSEESGVITITGVRPAAGQAAINETYDIMVIRDGIFEWLTINVNLTPLTDTTTTPPIIPPIIGGGGSPSRDSRPLWTGGFGVNQPQAPVVPQTPTQQLTQLQPQPQPSELHSAYMFGDNGDFSPHADITRAEASALLARTQLLNFDYGIRELPPGMGTFDAFDDVNPNDWFFYYIAWAYNAELIHGEEDTFRPNDPISREELAALLARTTILRAGETSFGDANDISNWARNYVSTVYHEGWMKGDHEGNFRPTDNINRAEVAVAINRMLGRLDSWSALNAADVENLTLARTFSDVGFNAWYFPAVLGSANNHRLTRDSGGAINWKYIVR